MRHSGISWTGEDRELLKRLCDKLGLNTTSVVRQGIRKLAEAEGIR